MISNRPVGPSTKNKIFLGVLALLGAGFVLISTNHYGVVIWPDSVFYISTARNLITGGGFVSFDGEPLTLWPPLYPGILAIISRIFGTDPLLTAPVVNAVIFGLIVYLAGMVLFKYLSSSPILAIEGTLAILFATPLFSISVVAFSEPLFILLVLLSFIFLETYLSTKSVTSLVLLSLSVALAFLTRYTGVIFLVWGALIILIFNQDGLRRRIAHLSLFAFIASLPVGIWVIRNYIVAHTLFGPRTPPAFSFSQILSLGFKSIADWYLPTIITSHLLIVLLMCAIAVFLIGFSIKGRWQWLRSNLKRNNLIYSFAISCGIFIVLYLGFVIISAINTYVSVFESRIWAPIFLPLTFLVILFARELSQQFRKYFSVRIVNSIVISGIALWLVYPMVTTMSYAANLVASGDGISGAAWMQSATARYIRQNPAMCTFYSNGPDVIYILAEVDAKWVPSRGGNINDISSLKGLWPKDSKACLVWFDNIDRTSLFTPNELLSITSLEQVIKFDDGVIYLITRK